MKTILRKNTCPFLDAKEDKNKCSKLIDDFKFFKTKNVKIKLKKHYDF